MDMAQETEDDSVWLNSDSVAVVGIQATKVHGTTCTVERDLEMDTDDMQKEILIKNKKKLVQFAVLLFH